MILVNPIACDDCEKPIDKTKGYIEYLPLRGGLQVNVYNSENSAGKILNKPMHFCSDSCHASYIGKIRAAIKPLPAPPATKPVPAAAAPIAPVPPAK